MSNSKTVLVAGATGQQGGSVARALLANGHQVRGLTRNVHSAKAKALAEMGATLVAGDYTDGESLKTAASGVDTIFAVTTPFESDVNAETEQGLALLNAARQANVGHIVFSSVGGAHQQTGVPHFESKYAVEEAIVASGVPYSILAPVYFMDNLLAPWTLPSVLGGSFAQALPGDQPLQQISVKNIGEFAATLVARREQVFGQRYDIAGDEISNNQLVAVLSGLLGREISYAEFPTAVLREQSEDMALMFEWFDQVGYSADIAGLRQAFPEVGWQDFAGWAAAQDWQAIVAAA